MSTHREETPFLRCEQRGTAAIEFAFVFPILFMLLYGTVVYAYTFVLQQAITFTAQHLAEAAVAVDPSPAGSYQARVQARVQALANDQLSWLPPSQRARVLGEGGQGVVPSFQTIDGADVVVVTLNFGLAGLFPAIALPGIGPVPPLPAQLEARATARIS